MKRGCITRAFIFIIILLGIIIYIVEKYGPIVEESIKKETIKFAETTILDEIKKAKQSIFSDSLKILVSNYLENLSSQTEEEIKTKTDSLSKEINSVLEDSEINLDEFEKLREKLK